MSFFKTNRIKDLVEAVRKDIRQLTTQATQSAKTYNIAFTFSLVFVAASFTVRGTTGVTIQPHQILRLSRRKTHILSPHLK